METLKNAKIGSTVQVVKLHGEGAVKRRIMDMGITKGVAVRGYELSLRRADAEMVEVQERS